MTYFSIKITQLLSCIYITRLFLEIILKKFHKKVIKDLQYPKVYVRILLDVLIKLSKRRTACPASCGLQRRKEV